MEIKITVARDGTVTMRVDGIKGRSCRDITKPLREALGLTTDDKATPEFYEATHEAERVRQGGRR